MHFAQWLLVTLRNEPVEEPIHKAQKPRLDLEVVGLAVAILPCTRQHLVDKLVGYDPVGVQVADRDQVVPLALGCFSKFLEKRIHKTPEFGPIAGKNLRPTGALCFACEHAPLLVP